MSTSLDEASTHTYEAQDDPPSALAKRGTRKRRESNSDAGDKDTSRKDSLSGAFARALVGTLAFVFRAPVRLFRPVKCE